MSRSDARKPLILGIGNVLMGDEGVGVHVAGRLAAAGLPSGVTVVDGGTGGFHLLGYLQDHDPVVIVDATIDGRPAGTVDVVHPRFASDFPRTLAAHDVGLRDLVESAALLGPLPTLHVVTVSIDAVQPMTLALSPAIEDAVPAVIAAIDTIAAGWAETAPSTTSHVRA